MAVDIHCPEYRFFKQFIEPTAKVIFDVGSRFDTKFSDFHGIVHYFEPNTNFLEKLKPLVKNKNCYFNNFGLSDKNEMIEYYNEQQSFVHRKLTHPDTYMNWTKSIFEVRRADEYIKNNTIKEIDFLKIDTEGYEFNVLKGFGDELKIINCIQFEYGGTYIDSGDKLKDVIEHLARYGFTDFSYLEFDGLIPLTSFEDHYQHTNIVCFNSKYLSKNM